MSQGQPTVSVIVPVYNGEKFLDQCLVALFSSDHAASEVIVVDDLSTDNSAEIGLEKGATLLSMSRRSGPAAARNHAAEHATGDILLFVDADVIVKPDAIGRVVADFKQNPDVSALFGSYDDEPGERNFLSQYKNLQHHFVHQNSNREASTFWAGLGAVRREAFGDVGGFDCDRFAIPSIEDIELGARLRLAGHRILLDRKIQAKHLKKWKLVSLLKTEIFCRAMPWAKLILTSQGMINDMNLKTADRLSAILVGLSAALLPLIFWQPVLILLLLVFLVSFVFLNRKIFGFFYKKKGLLFTILVFPWQLFYFFYSGVTFVLSWIRYALPRVLGFGKATEVGRVRNVQ